MDKRSIIFIISVSLSIFVISLFFSHQRDKKIYQQRLETKKIEKRELELLEQTAIEKTITSLQLPLIYLFRDESCTQFLSKAIWLGDTAMLMAPHSIPERVYHKDDSGNISSLQLFLNNEKQNPFLVYTKVDKKPIIPFIEKDNYSALEVYLWEPSNDVVSWAYISANKIKVPLQKEKSKFFNP